jgi:hypothetical protein
MPHKVSISPLLHLESYNHYQPGEANLFVIDPAGRIVLKVIGGVSHAKLQRVFTALGGLLACQS